jgi:7-cyano-7-deazaguanine synthase
MNELTTEQVEVLRKIVRDSADRPTAKAVVLVSGGMDSAVALSLALRDNDEVVAVSFDYGSKHNAVEKAAAKRLINWYRENGHIIEHVEIDLPRIFGGAGSALMNESEMPNLTYQQIAEGEGPSPTVVPFRNGVLLSVATAIAITRNASLLYAGMHAEDARGFAYPDCTPEFLGAFAACVYVGTYHDVNLRVPFQYSMKSDIVLLGLKMGTPFDLTWSCYSPVVKTEPSAVEGHIAYACGVCPTCVERIEAFRVNGVIDPIPYDEEIDWDGCQPFLS